MLLILISDFFLPAFVAHSYVEVVTAEKDLRSLGHDVHILVKTRVYGSFRTARADSLYFGYRIRKLKQTLASRKELTHKVGSKTKAHNGNIKLVNDLSQLINVLRREKLTFVSNYNVAVGMSCYENIVNVFAVEDDLAGSGKPYP